MRGGVRPQWRKGRKRPGGGLSVALPGEFVAVDPAVVVGVVEAGGRVFVEDDRGARVELERGAGADRGQRTLDHVFDGADFGGTEGEEEAAAGIEDGADTHGEGMLRHGVEGAENGAVVAERLLGENFDPSAGAERTGGFVEADVAVAAETEQLDIDAAGVEDTLFVTAAFGVEIGRGAVGHVRAGWVDVDVAEKIFPHEIPVGLVVRAGETDVFVEVERGDAAEIEALVAVEPDEFLIEAERGAPGGEAEDGVGFFADDAGDDFGAEDAADFGGFADNDFHGKK